MNLNFGQCLTLLIIAFVFALIVCRCLLAVVNRLFLVIETAKQELLGKGSSGGKFNLMAEIFSFAKPALQGWFQGVIGGKK